MSEECTWVSRSNGVRIVERQQVVKICQLTRMTISTLALERRTTSGLSHNTIKYSPTFSKHLSPSLSCTLEFLVIRVRLPIRFVADAILLPTHLPWKWAVGRFHRAKLSGSTLLPQFDIAMIDEITMETKTKLQRKMKRSERTRRELLCVPYHHVVS